MAPRQPPPDTGPEPYRVCEIKTQGKKGTSKKDDDRARELLERTAWQVQPIMRKRGWRVGVLLEMPDKVKDRLGDNWNKGERVRLKLRKQNGEWELYEQVLAVMLHELVHNEFGPHDGKFFARLAELEKECEDLMAKGLGGTGVGFDAKGMELGHRGGWGGIETRDAITAAVDAANKRAKQHAAMGPPGGRKLGAGASAVSSKSPRSAAAEAAERRRKNEAFAKEHGLMDDVVVLSDDEEEDEEVVEVAVTEKSPEKKTKLKPQLQFSFQGRACPCYAAPRADETHVTQCRAKETGASVDKNVEPVNPPERGKEEVSGSGSAPSMHGASVRTSPRAASRKRPPQDVIIIDDSDDDDTPVVPATTTARSRNQNNSKGTILNKTWRCGACTLVNVECDSRCQACDLWRFSRGTPSASRPTGYSVDD